MVDTLASPFLDYDGTRSSSAIPSEKSTGSATCTSRPPPWTRPTSPPSAGQLLCSRRCSSSPLQRPRTLRLSPPAPTDACTESTPPFRRRPRDLSLYRVVTGRGGCGRRSGRRHFGASHRRHQRADHHRREQRERLSASRHCAISRFAAGTGQTSSQSLGASSTTIAPQPPSFDELFWSTGNGNIYVPRSVRRRRGRHLLDSRFPTTASRLARHPASPR